jgi:hypothetical protein
VSSSRCCNAAGSSCAGGKGHQHWEAIFNRIVWREGFEEHLRELARAATAEPAGERLTPA